ncbi:DNA-binding response regulator [Candidatus Epulonipiscium fishelsonii]|uniref:DNA-binding response regulator n=1 Tax=Candidatus Epulonipiscium fishelsonii TaxID=77094 RepID=A0ACC8XC26_9FIRM|nr:DNA-binding response regulator [Epulopiscium sp. SCG-B11WGA-EpuloA1]ONI42461.1 DNA-binding response regulator [Epulopiscium sp. SCG-B05WGA-EpuloA1]ONI47852.1 DNA-binding response regulator [Epulopiscium sp. SCG-C06WGA-EpuloA1]
MSNLILIVDDEKEIRDLIAIYLKNEGYNYKFASTGLEAIKAVEEGDIELIILDVMMPVVNGIDACVEIRRKHNIPIIMLSAKVEDIDKIMGLSVGADDYISKPFNPLELIARVKAQIRRATQLNSTKQDADILIENELTLNLKEGKLYKNNEEIFITPTELKILKLLWINKGITFANKDIYEKVWDQDYMENNNTVMVHIRKLREKIEEHPRKPLYIFTVWGIGYKFGI